MSPLAGLMPFEWSLIHEQTTERRALARLYVPDPRSRSGKRLPGASGPHDRGLSTRREHRHGGSSGCRSPVPFDTLRDFEPITLVGLVPFLLVTNAKLPPDNLGELLAWVKANPGKVNYSSFGSNTTNHLAGEAFKVAAGIEATHVPYKGSSPSITDLLGGQVQYTFDTITATLPHVRSGGLKAIAVALGERSALVPDVPTLSESGLPGFTAGTWFGMMAPKGTPPAIIDKLHREVVAVLRSDAMRKEFAAKGIETGGNTPQEFAKFIGDESARWTELAARIDLKPQ